MTEQRREARIQALTKKIKLCTVGSAMGFVATAIGIGGAIYFRNNTPLIQTIYPMALSALLAGKALGISEGMSVLEV